MDLQLLSYAHWLAPLLLGGLLLAIAWFWLKPFFWRIFLCVVPTTLALMVMGNAWYNAQRPPITSNASDDPPLAGTVVFSSSAPMVSADKVKELATRWLKDWHDSKQEKGKPREPLDLDEVVQKVEGGERSERVELQYAMPKGATPEDVLSFLKYLSRELNSARFRFNLGVDLAGGTILVYEVDPKGAIREGFKSADLVAPLKKRIDPANLMEITIRPSDTDPPRVEIILPMQSAKGGSQGLGDIERVKEKIRRQGNLEFRILADTRFPEDRSAIAEAKEIVQGLGDSADFSRLPAPEGYAWVELDQKEINERVTRLPDGFNEPAGEGTGVYRVPNLNRFFLLTRVPPGDAVVTGDYLTRADPYLDPAKGWVVTFALNSEGGSRMGRLTENNKGHYMATILDDKINSYANLKDVLHDQIQVELGGGAGRETKQKVDDLVLVLRSGALPATLKKDPVSELSLGPTLGEDTIERGWKAIVVAFVLVVAFMMFYYRFAGIVASTALLANLLLTVGFMVAVKAVFTLPGLAGLVLMLGMALDSNVLIYERLREERERGSGLALAIRNAYNLSFPTIIDTHLTTIFTGIVLYIVGNDQLKGFGISLVVGLMISLFTSLYMTRLIFDIFLAKGWLREFHMMKLISRPSINFMGARYYWFTATVALSLLGLGIFLYRGEDALNIDFTGGTAYHVVFKEGQKIEEVRKTLTAEVADKTKNLTDVNVEALSRIGATGAPTEYVIRTTYRDAKGKFDREKVRQIVSERFAGQLVEVKVEAKEVPPPPNSKFTHHYLLSSGNDIAIAPDRVRRLVGEWLSETWHKQGEGGRERIDKPSDFFAVDRIPEDKGKEEPGSKEERGLLDKVTLYFKLPEGSTPGDATALMEAVTGGLSGAKSERLENFDSQVAGQMRTRALQAIALSWLVICLYLWFRFGNWTFGIAAVLCLIHGLLFTIGLISIAGLVSRTPWGGFLDDFKIDLTAVAALLTVVGYAVNDTIVVFDRIREVRGKSPELTERMINETINQTLSRTLLTGISVFLVLFTLYFFGGPGVHLFAFIMIIGVLIGTYGSIYIACPLLLMFGEGKQRELVRRKQPQEAGV